mmetsp:Transcript_46949/g.53024  ORF Transcript_46949/g.53024 Transcript_46949/m.53024 type:complete len:635 (-) Transcript_46949:178-2082(-)
MTTNDEAMVAVGDNNDNDDDDNGYNDDESILIPWNNPIIKKLELKWGEYYVIDVQDDEYTDDDESESVDGISEANEEEGNNIVWMDTDNNTEPVIHAVVPLLSYKNGSSIQATAKDETLSFICLSEVLLQNIFEYAACQPFDVLPIEKTCKKFHKVLRADGNFRFFRYKFHEDGTYKYFGKPAYMVECTRDNMFCYHGLQMIRKTQKKLCYINFLLEFLKINFLFETAQQDNMSHSSLGQTDDDDDMLKIAGENFKHVATKVMSKMMTKHQQGVANFSFRLRGDTVGYLTELLQGYMITKLENALRMAIHREDGSYPMVTKDDILVLDKFSSSHNSTNFGLSEDIIPSEIRRKIIRMIQAGITKMTGEAFAVAEIKLLHTMGVLLVTAYESSMNYNYSPISSYQIIYPSTDNVNVSDVDSIITQDEDTQRRLTNNVSVSDDDSDNSVDEDDQRWLQRWLTAATDAAAEQEQINNESASGVNSIITQDANTQWTLTDSDAAVATATAEQERIFAVELINYYSTTMFSVPPPPVFSLCDDEQTPNEYEYIIYTIVPGQIKEAARQNRIFPNIVYGLNWLACPGSTVEEEMEIEIAYYDWDKRTITSSQHKNGQDWDDNVDVDVDADSTLGDYWKVL